MNIEILFLFVIFSGAVSDDDLIIETPKGFIKGLKQMTPKGTPFYSFLGVPFAQPPVGPLRFKNPVEAAPWEGVLNASKQPNQCLQYDILEFSQQKEPKGSEDCLYLNVFTQNRRGSRMPVMFFIHGGGFMSGNASTYGPFNLLDHEIVLVVIQFRLNVFGFISTDDENLPGNYGLLDQNFALKWVKENIANFGGDASRVTIFGNSAGGASVHYHMVSPLSRGLFRNAIAQSGVAICPWALNRNHRNISQEFGQAVGCPLELSNTSEYVKCLKRKGSKELIKASKKLTKIAYLPMSPGPRIDGHFIPEEPSAIIVKKQYAPVNMMLGMLRDDGAAMVYVLSSNETHYTKLMNQFSEYGPAFLGTQEESISPSIADRIYQRHLKGKPINRKAHKELEQVLTDSYTRYCVDAASLLHSSDPRIDLYAYKIHHRGQKSIGDQFTVEESENWIAHMDELQYLFQVGHKPATLMEIPRDQKFQDLMTKLWTNFAATGNPTPDDSLGFRWERGDITNFKYLKMTTTPTNEKLSSKEFQTLDFWLSLPFEQNNHMRHLITRQKEEL